MYRAVRILFHSEVSWVVEVMVGAQSRNSRLYKL